MGLLTSSQLTFYEIDDTYNLTISPECIPISCDTNNKTTSTISQKISFGMYKGTTRIGTSACVINNNPTYVSITDITQATSSADGYFIVNISSDITISNMTDVFKVSITSNDSEKFYFDKYITLIKSISGSNGIGISEINEYYQVSSSNTTVPSSWETTVPSMTSTNKYLWNYEVITYTNNTTKDTDKRVIGVYGDTGKDGISITQVKNYYLVTASSSGVTKETSGWEDTVQQMTPTNKYLWNYEDVIGTKDSSTYTISSSDPCIIGVYGDTGEDGISSIQFGIYCSDGDAFQNGQGSKELKTYAFDGINSIEDGTYQWYKSKDGTWEKINIYDKSTAIYKDDRYIQKSDGKIVSGSTTKSLIVPVSPNTSYSIYIPNIAESNSRSIVAESSDSEFTIGNTYSLLSSENLDYPIEITTSDQAKYIMVFFSTGASYDYETNSNGIIIYCNNSISFNNLPSFSSINIYGSDIDGSRTYKCEFEYNDKQYDAYYTLKDLNDIYQSEIRTIGGTSIRNNNPYIIAYAVIYKNGEELDSLVADTFIPTDMQENPTESNNYYLIQNGTVSLKYFNTTTSSWIDPTISGQTYRYNWNKINTAKTSINFIENNKIIIITSDDISGSDVIECDIYDSNSNALSVCQKEFNDLNDVYISASAPSSPITGQIWVDTSSNPYIMKVYNGSIWETVNEETNYFTSRPYEVQSNGYCYKKGDIWILESDYTFGEATKKKGSSMICINSNTSFSFDDWNEIGDYTKVESLSNDIGTLTQRIQITDSGLYIYGSSNGTSSPFYSKFTNTDLGFYETGTDTEEDTKVAWIGNKNLHAKETIIEGKLAVLSPSDASDVALSSSNDDSPYIRIGDYVIQCESNGSLSIMKA